MPVLALAIIVEARATIGKWLDNTPAWLRLVQGILWAVPLVLYTYLEPKAFLVIGGKANPNSGTDVVIASISAGIGVLVGAPTVGVLVGSSAKIMASLYVGARFARIRIGRARNIIRCKRIMRRYRRNHDSYLEEIIRVTSQTLALSLNYGQMNRLLAALDREDLMRLGIEGPTAKHVDGDLAIRLTYGQITRMLAPLNREGLTTVAVKIPVGIHIDDGLDIGTALKLASEHRSELLGELKEIEEGRIDLKDLLKEIKDSKDDYNARKKNIIEKLAQELTKYAIE